MESTHFIASLVSSIIGLLLVATATAGLAHKLKLPFTVLIVLVGIGLMELARVGPAFLHPILEYNISPEIILFVFLPTLIFESAFNLNSRQLRRNILPVITLAVPGLIISTALIGTIVHFFTGLEFAAALLLGAILSATDPVAVISIFKQLGAPGRLNILVEGESLFNDATSIVVAKILTAVIAAGYFTLSTITGGIIDFLIIFCGGILVGWLAAVITGLILGYVESDPFIEISLTTILAYFSFLIAEELFHVSGVMATVAAGVTMGSWGRAKISSSIIGYMENFWEYMAHVANALIFLLVGMRVNLPALFSSLDKLVGVIVAMLISRAFVIYTLTPICGRLPGVEPVSRPYQTVMWWGGLRGAIALAIVLSLDDFKYAEMFLALVMGAVLFTLLAQGLSIAKLVHWLGLDQMTPADRFARAEGLLAAKSHALSKIPELQEGGLFSHRIAEQLQNSCIKESNALRDEVDELHRTTINHEQERQLLATRCFGLEKTLYYELFSKSHLSEQAYRDLCHSVEVQLEAFQASSHLPRYTLHPPIENFFTLTIEKIPRLPLLGYLIEQQRMEKLARDYEEAWGRYQGSGKILLSLEEITKLAAIHPDTVVEIKEHYLRWQEAARNRLDRTAAQFPEFVTTMQARLAGRLMAEAEKKIIEKESRSGAIPPGVISNILVELSNRIWKLRGRDLARLHIEPMEVLKKVPFFQDTSSEDFPQIIDRLRPLTMTENRPIIQQGDAGDSLFLIGRGVVRVSRASDGREIDLATLMAGDFFGEMALLHHKPRSATCRTITPSVIYELKSEDLEELRKICPSIQTALEKADLTRRAGTSCRSKY